MSEFAWAQVVRYLAASTPPCDLAALYALTAPDALLIVGNTLVPRSEITAAEYARQVGYVFAGPPADDLGPRFVPIEPITWLPDAGGGTLQASVREVETDSQVTAIFRLSGPELSVYGAYLDEAPPPGPAVVVTRCLGELVHWEPHEEYPIWPLTGLALAFHRLHGTIELPLRALPEARFTCQGRGDCCNVALWPITTNANAEVALARMPWDTLGERGPRLSANPDDDLDDSLLRTFLLDGDAQGRCRANGAGGCTVHKTLGWQPIAPCMQYPFIFTPTPDGICVTATFTCDTVAENAGRPFAEQADDLRQRFQPAQALRSPIPTMVPLFPDGPSLTWPAYRVVEDRLLAVLNDPQQAIKERLILGNRLMTALLQHGRRDPAVIGPAEVARIWAGKLPALPAGDAALADTLIRVMLRDDVADTPRALLGGGRLAAWQAGQVTTLGSDLDEAMLVRYLRTYYFRKAGLQQMGVAFPWGMLNWLYRLWHCDALYRAKMDGVPADHALQLGTVRRLELAHWHSSRHELLHDRTLGFGPAMIRPDTWASLLLP